MKKIVLSALIVCGMMATLLTGCSNNMAKTGGDNAQTESTQKTEVTKTEENTENTDSDISALAGQTITVWSQAIGPNADELEKICEDFTKETGIIVEFSAPGTDYENLLRMKMASNEMPDIWSTHGWAVKRYSEVLADLTDEEWVKRIVPSIAAQVTDENGRVLSMCIDSATNGIGYNSDIFEEYGLEVPKTIDELYAVCDAILKKSNGTVTPIHLGGGDGWPVASIVNSLSTTLCVSDEVHNYSEALSDGTFDWENYRPIGDFLKTIVERGYVNVDCLTATNDDTAKALASGEAAIALVGSVRNSVINYNPDAKTGFFGVPTFWEGDEPVVIGGESDAFGIWKDTQHMEACKAFLNYLARPDVNEKCCEKLNIRSAFKDVDADLGDMQVYYNNISSLRVMPYFDRASFPSGMWDAMQKYGQLLLTEDYSVDDYLNDMSGDYTRLLSQ